MGDETATTPLEVPKKRRKGVRKSKTGCMTCKIRHVRCDEGYPCKRCADSGRLCDFLNPHPEGRPPQPPRQLKKSKAIAKVVQKYPLQPKPAYSLSPTLDAHEINHLEYFRLVSTRSFSSHFGNSLWNETILQIAHFEDSIRTAIVALTIVVRNQNTPLRSIERRESACKYTSAVRVLNHRLDGSEFSWKLALISSLLFTAFEAYVGTEKAAFQHLSAGFAMLKEYSSKFQVPSDTLKELSSAFSSFDIQASTFACSYQPTYSSFTHISSIFASIGEARKCLGNIFASIHIFWKASGYAHRTFPYKAFLPAIEKSHINITSHLSQWSATFTSFLALLGSTIFLVAVEILQIQHLTAKVQIETYFYRDQLAYDAFITNFIHIVNLASAVVEKLLAGSGGIVPSFSFEVGIIPSLYFTARRCRDPTMRRKAIGLLERSGVEGLWDGKAMAAASRWVMKLEEEGGVMDDDFIPEARRLREVGDTMIGWRKG